MDEILERPQAPTRHRLDVGAYTKMAQAGILTHPRRVELIDGEIFDMAAIGSPHAAVTNRLVRSFAGAAADRRTLVSVQNPLRLDGYSEPQPDFTLLRPRADDYHGGHPNAGDVLLLVEVSESSLAHERGTKLALYARFGVPEVWIIDLQGAAVEVYREPAGDDYAIKERRAAGSLAPVGVPQVSIDIGVLLA
jgi:Uma2 family endonuclease